MIGLEIHLYPEAGRKLFCNCSFGDTCEICTAHPGAKPMAASSRAIIETIKLAHMFGCNIEKMARFLRKHYFYPDLPANFQRTSTPFGKGGHVGKIRIREVHLEEDAGRYDPRSGKVDLGRAGVAIIEVVSEPDISNAKEAVEFMRDVLCAARYARISNGTEFKADVNVSCGLARVEVKNIGSLRGIRKAIEFELMRQTDILQDGGVVERETRHYDESTGKTIRSREKETESDYRMLDDPDVCEIDIGLIGMKAKIPEGLFERRKRYEKVFGLGLQESIAVTDSAKLADFFEKAASKIEPRKAALWIKDELFGELIYRSIAFEDIIEKKERFLQIMEEYAKGFITKVQSRRMLRDAIDGKMEAFEMSVKQAVIDVICAHPDAVRKYMAGKKSALDFLVGQACKLSGADARVVREHILESLKMK